MDDNTLRDNRWRNVAKLFSDAMTRRGKTSFADFLKALEPARTKALALCQSEEEQIIVWCRYKEQRLFAAAETYVDSQLWGQLVDDFKAQPGLDTERIEYILEVAVVSRSRYARQGKI